MINSYENLNSIDLICYALISIALTRSWVCLNPSYSHEGTIDNEVFPLLEKSKKKNSLEGSLILSYSHSERKTITTKILSKLKQKTKF